MSVKSGDVFGSPFKFLFKKNETVTPLQCEKAREVQAINTELIISKQINKSGNHWSKSDSVAKILIKDFSWLRAKSAYVKAGSIYEGVKVFKLQP